MLLNVAREIEPDINLVLNIDTEVNDNTFLPMGVRDALLLILNRFGQIKEDMYKKDVSTLTGTSFPVVRNRQETCCKGVFIYVTEKYFYSKGNSFTCALFLALWHVFPMTIRLQPKNSLSYSWS